MLNHDGCVALKIMGLCLNFHECQSLGIFCCHAVVCGQKTPPE
ncbi:hypothetical protein CSUI_007784, partial [Cystoisospora suis]